MEKFNNTQLCLVSFFPYLCCLIWKLFSEAETFSLEITQLEALINCKLIFNLKLNVMLINLYIEIEFITQGIKLLHLF